MFPLLKETLNKTKSERPITCLTGPAKRGDFTIMDKHLKELLSIFRSVTAKWDSNIVKVIGGKSGYYSTMILNSKISSKELIDRLKKRNIYASSNKRAYYNKENYDNSIRISLARLNKNEVKVVLEIIYEEILTLM